MSERVNEEGFLMSDVDPINPYRSVKINELAAALAKAQGEFQVATRSQENKYYKHRYEDLVDIVSASRPSLTKNGLSVIQQIKHVDDGSSILHTILFHSSGQWIETRMKLSPPKQEIQTLTSYTSSMKRLAYASLVGVVAESEDDDGFIADTYHREKFAEGTTSKFKPTEQKYEVISTEQREELEYELSAPEMESYIDEIMEYFKIQTLADLPKEHYHSTRQRLMSIKKARQKDLR